MGLFFRKKKFDDYYDPYDDFDLEDEIVGEVQRIIKAESADTLPDYEKTIRDDEETRKHLSKLFEVIQAFKEDEIIVALIVLRENYPDLWHKVNAKVDLEQRKILSDYEELSKGVKKNDK